MATVTTGYLNKDGKVRFIDDILISTLFLDTASINSLSSLSGENIVTINPSTGEISSNSGSDFYTVENGISESSGTLKLGGSLTGNTNISFGINNLTFELDGIGELKIDISSTGDYSIVNGVKELFKIDGTTKDLEISTDAGVALKFDYGNDNLYINTPIKIGDDSLAPIVTLDNAYGTGVTQPIISRSGSAEESITTSTSGHTFVFTEDNMSDIILPDPALSEGRIIVLKLFNTLQTSNINIKSDSASTSSTIEDSAYNVGFTWLVNLAKTRSSIMLQADASADRWYVITNDII